MAATFTTYVANSGQGILVNAATGAITQSGTTAPTGTTVFSLPPAQAYGLRSNFAIQIDVGGTGSWSALEVDILGSLDGVKFYKIMAITTTGGSLNFLGGSGLKSIGASVPTATVSSGAPTVTVSFVG